MTYLFFHSAILLSALPWLPQDQACPSSVFMPSCIVLLTSTKLVFVLRSQIRARNGSPQTPWHISHDLVLGIARFCIEEDK